jgi:RNA polymerase sigma factor (sigma-70 family)
MSLWMQRRMAQGPERSEHLREDGKIAEMAGADDRYSMVLRAFMEHRPQLRRIIAGMGLGAADAEDILQEVSIEALRRDQPFGQDGEATRWITRITINRCLLEYRKRQRFVRNAALAVQRREAPVSRADGLVQDAIQREEIEAMRKALPELDGTLLVPVVLQYFCGMTSDEIGKVLGISGPAVRTRVREARMILAKRLERLER